tara:strand:- start:1208 stop:1630 length:423 start_codon:yes stop_codon:yes gene_type:complete
MPTQTGFWIQVKNGEVKQVWDYKPDAQRMSTESGWRAASEVKPDLVDNREIMTAHSFDLDADPAQIVWAKRELTVDERKGGLVGQANSAFQEVANEQTQIEVDDTDASGDLDAVSAAKVVKDARIAAINAATTHDEVDAL